MTKRSFLGGTALAVILTCSSLYGGQLILTGLPQYNIDPITGIGTDRVDILSINLDPVNGAIHGLPGDPALGWGFSIDWDSNAGDYISFTGSHLTGDISGISSGGYSDLIGTGPYGGGSTTSLAVPFGSNWSQLFIDATTGAGGLVIDAGAIPGGEYIGQLVMSFDVFDGDPGDNANTIGSGQFSSDVSVLVDTPPDTPPDPGPGGDAPEPGTWLMMLSGAGVTFLVKRRFA